MAQNIKSSQKKFATMAVRATSYMHFHHFSFKRVIFDKINNFFISWEALKTK
jgi:hypothetical protein